MGEGISYLPAHFPDKLREYLVARGDSTLDMLGDPAILRRRKLGAFCSVKCPGGLILQTYDLMRSVCQTDVVVVSGFHSPVERECLTLLLRAKHPVIICPARSIKEMRLPAEYKTPLAEGRLLLLSCFESKQRRITVESARIRNEFVVAISDDVFVSYAAPDSKTEEFCRKMLAWGKPLYTLKSEYNAGLMALGAKIAEAGREELMKLKQVSKEIE